MAIFKVENEFNNMLQLSQNEDKWKLLSVTGLNQPPANIITSVVPGFDGARFNSSRLEARNIVITLAIVDHTETNRMILNSVIYSKRYIKVYYKNNSLDVYIEGYVESFEYDVFEQGIKAQISIICTNPYWIDKNSNMAILTPSVDLFEFPFSIPEEGIPLGGLTRDFSNAVINNGTVETGAVITITSNYSTTNPIITNMATHQTMKLNTTLMAGDQIIISTLRSKKFIKKYSNGQMYNIINDLDASSSWINIRPGENTFILQADHGSQFMQASVAVQNLYGGV
jgi:hypothetical protein